MIQKTPSEATRASLELYVEYLNAATPVRLEQLLAHLRKTEGPADRLDGSATSLIALWGWVQREIRRGLPGAPADPVVSRFEFFQWPVDVNTAKRGWLTQLASAYLLRVAQSADPSARWAIPEPDPDDIRWADDHEPGLASAASEFWAIESALINIAELAIDAPQVTSEDHVYKQFVARYGDVPGAGLGGGLLEWLRDPIPAQRSVPSVQWNEAAAGQALEVAGRAGVGWRTGLRLDEATTLLAELGASTLDERRPPGDELAAERSGYLDYVIAETKILVEVEIGRRGVSEMRFTSNGAAHGDWVKFEIALRDVAKRYRGQVLDIGT